jgi:hypothetical protein
MVGTQSDGSGSHETSREEASSTPDRARSPVLSGMSEAELEAIVSKLRTDKNLVIPAIPSARERLGAVTERLLLNSSRSLDPREAAAAREEAARHFWYISLGEGIAGPLDIAALRTHWERGELGPDSFCWREGFDGWQLLCRVPGLAEFLAPPSQAALTPANLVPEERSSAPDFLLKGADALRVLSDDAPRSLDTSSLLPPFLEPEPITEPAAPAALDPIPAARPPQDVAGVHQVLSTGTRAQVEVRIRGGLWLALGGGMVGGFLMACAMLLLGLPNGSGVASRGTLLDSVTPSGATTAEASTRSPAQAGSAVTPSTPAHGPGASQAAPTGMALLPGTAAPGPVATAPTWESASWAPFSVAPRSGITAPALGLNKGTGLGGAAVASVTSSSTPRTLTPPTHARSEAAGISGPAITPSRTVAPDPVMRKPAKAEALPEREIEFEDRAAPQPKEDELELEDDLGPDKEFARELEPQQPANRASRTVWIPPAPVAPPTPATLAQSEVFAVVLANKGDIASCGSAQAKPVEDGTRVVVRWTILPSGKVTDVDTESANFQGTPLADCLEGKIRTWTFPKHREQGSPVRFPFVF